MNDLKISSDGRMPKLGLWMRRPPGFSMEGLARMLSRFNCFRPCNPPDCSLPGFSVHGILQGRILEWLSMPSSSGSS